MTILCLIQDIHQSTYQLMKSNDVFIRGEYVYQIAYSLYQRDFFQVQNKLIYFDELVEELGCQVTNSFVFKNKRYLFSQKGKAVIDYVLVIYHHVLLQKLRKKECSSPRINDFLKTKPLHQIRRIPGMVTTYAKAIRSMYRDMKNNDTTKRRVLVIPRDFQNISKMFGFIVPRHASTEDLSNRLGEALHQAEWFVEVDEREYFAELITFRYHIIL